MTQIKLTLLENSQQGYHIILNSPESPDSVQGILPPLPPELELSFLNWQSAYRDFEDVRIAADFRAIKAKKITQHSASEERNSVRNILNQWLNEGGENWLPVRDELNAIAGKLTNSKSEISFFLDVENDNKLSRIPWQEWSLLEQKYSQAELAIRIKGSDKIKPIPQYEQVRILVVVGQSKGIDTQADLKVIQNLEKKGAEVVILNQPSIDELSQALWLEKGYHIFVYTGHSSSDATGKIGSIELNEQQSLSIDGLKYAFQTAINQGLQLAIFNSCDGLGLAYQLAELNLPRLVVMREPVPDKVAVEFLKYFFEEFSQNKSLFTSVNRAKKRLQPREQQYPGAMWLPTICIRESALDQPLIWENLWENLIENPPSPPAVTPIKISPSTENKTDEKPADINSNTQELKGSKKESQSLKVWLLLAATLLGLALIGFIITQWGKKQENAIAPTPPVSTPTPTPTPSQNQYFTDVADLPLGTWRYGGSTSTALLRKKVKDRLQQVLPLFNLNYYDHPTLPPGSGTGIKMLLDGQISFSESSRPLNQEELETAKNKGFQLKQLPVALDALGVVVNPSLEIKGLTVQQLKDIYTGKITNWSQVGGPDLEIVPFSRYPDAGGTPEYFQDEILGGEEFGDRLVWTYNTTEGVGKVSQVKGGIYYGSASEVIPQCKVKPISIAKDSNSDFIPSYQGSLVSPENCPNQRNKPNFEAFKNEQYPLSRRLFVIIREDGTLDQKAGEAYYKLLLTDEGQKLIEEAGYIPIR